MNCSLILEATLAAVTNHLWQSTLFVLGVWPLAWLLRRNKANTRYCLWMIASLKFLLPFSIFFAVGNTLRTKFPSPLQAIAVSRSMEQFTTPVAAPHTSISASHFGAERNSHVLSAGTMALLVLVTIWISGTCVIMLAWFREWWRVRGLVLDVLYRSSLDGVPIASVSGIAEPGVFGIFQPVLLLPEKLSDQLSTEQLNMIFSHELCHIRRRDNLTAVFYMSVAMIFWFDPVVWWIKNRLVEERERACDEYVLAAGNDAEQYAQGLLNACKCCLTTPLPCVSGVTGSDLKKRIFRIMQGSFVKELGPAKRAMLIIAGLIAIASPVTIGLIDAPLGSVSAAIEASPSFEVASIRPHDPKNLGSSVGGQFPRYFIRGESTEMILSNAFDIQTYRLLGLPRWAKSDRYDLEAKMDDSFASLPAEQQYKMSLLMFQSLLKDRFRLQYHRSMIQATTYELISSDHGAKLHPVASTEPGMMSLGSDAQGNHTLTARAYTLGNICAQLSVMVGGVVSDGTGLPGNYDFDLRWTREDTQIPKDSGSSPDTGLTLRETLEDKYGLKLVPHKGQITAIVIDDIQRPTPN